MSPFSRVAALADDDRATDAAPAPAVLLLAVSTFFGDGDGAKVGSVGACSWDRYAIRFDPQSSGSIADSIRAIIFL